MSRTTRQQKIEIIRSETREQANTRQRVADILTDINEATIDDIIAGDNITIDKTDPSKPIIKSSAGGGDYAKKDGSNLTLPAFRDNLNIQVSATNLAKNSKGLVNSNSYWVRDVAVSKALESGKTYTVKVWTKTGNQNTNAYFSIGDQTGHLVNLTKISPTEFAGKIVMPRNSNGNLVLFRQPDDSSWYQFEAIKIVEGDMITKDWSPSPDDAATISFATEGEVESNTPPSSENNKAISLFGLWKWWKKAIQYLYLQPTTANTIPNKDWSDGLIRWFTNRDGINKRFALVDASPTVDKIAILTPTGTLKPITSVPINQLAKVYGENSLGVVSYNEAVEFKKVDTSNTEPTILQLIEKGVDRVDYPNLSRIYFNYGTKWGYITLTEVMV